MNFLGKKISANNPAVEQICIDSKKNAQEVIDLFKEHFANNGGEEHRVYGNLRKLAEKLQADCEFLEQEESLVAQFLLTALNKSKTPKN